MGRNSRSKAERRQAQGAKAGEERQSPEARVLAATQRMLDEVQRWARVVEEAEESCLWVRLPEALEELADGAHPLSGLQHELAEMVEAWQIVQNDEPVAGEWPRAARKGGGTIRWKPPLRPGDILFSRRLVLEGRMSSTTGYRDQAHANGTYYARAEQDQQDDLSAECGRPTPKGAPCRSRSVYVPPAGFSAGVGCWRHISASDAERTAGIYDRVVGETSCPGCGAEAGTECRDSENDGDRRPFTPVDGQWPRMRSFQGRKVHDLRLAGSVASP